MIKATLEKCCFPRLLPSCHHYVYKSTIKDREYKIPTLRNLCCLFLTPYPAIRNFPSISQLLLTSIYFLLMIFSEFWKGSVFFLALAMRRSKDNHSGSMPGTTRGTRGFYLFKNVETKIILRLVSEKQTKAMRTLYTQVYCLAKKET